MNNIKYKTCGLTLLLGFANTAALAHDPVFGIGPHVLFKGGFEAALDIDTSKAADKKDQGFALNATYGITGDWAIGVGIPYEFKDNGTNTSDGTSDLAAFSKYRFWRKDSLGLQESGAVFLKVIADTASTSKTPSLGTGATDTILGLTYGYEGRKWYRWSSVRYRFNGKGNAGVDRADKILLDFVGGIRPTLTGYLEPDTVWLLELNGEYGKQASVKGGNLVNTGGTEWFISPGIFWTKRNFAIKAGVQIPVSSNLNGNQNKSDYRAKLIFEWHM